MGAATVLYVEVLEACGPCISCGVAFAMPREFKARKLEDHSNFYCPNGHPQRYLGETEAELLKKQLEQKQKQLEWKDQEIKRQRERTESAERGRAVYQGKYNRMKNRVGNGVCPCCKRSFQNLKSHMTIKHPGFKKPVSDEIDQ